ncbi:type I glyceraldehyde-3-phosphate dehydrogenase [Candidatus Endowatersipora endosymbiont of Watersipora subatra]|uniref:type I glyceraldehyde-3-phosphate dehydrogenase n=1 Tax=Candidatus Endowatersipora endosymbiont of Watersipora subatra TaxID=3077946 RepID=UPI00312C913D
MSVRGLRVAINGFGRIGRNTLRALYESQHTDIEVVAINDSGSIETNAHLLRYDSIHGCFPWEIKTTSKGINAGRGLIPIFNYRDPAKLPWRQLDVDIVMECTGFFTERPQADIHLFSGAKRVLISAPGKNVDKTIVYGINHKRITKKDLVISASSCTTNCLVPIASVLHAEVGIQYGFVTTVHSYTGDQTLLDRNHKDLYRSRSATQSIIPTSTGLAKGVGCIIPELEGKLDGSSLRVPTANVSLIDFKFKANRKTSVNEINKAIEKAARGELKYVLDYDIQPKVSIDFNHNSHSSIFAPAQTKVIDEEMIQVMSWYDNEWGFSCRMNDIAAEIGKNI